MENEREREREGDLSCCSKRCLNSDRINGVVLESLQKQSALFVHASLVLQLFPVPTASHFFHNSSFLCHPRQVAV